jgi:hypothetical protein
MPCRCCANRLQLGCLDACGLLIFHITNTAPNDIFLLEVEFLNTKIRLSNQSPIIVAGDKPTFDISQLNEKFTFIGFLYRNGTPVVLIDANAMQYDCIGFNTQIGSPTQNTQTQPLTIL